MLTIIIPCYNEKNINQSVKIYRPNIKNNSINSWLGWVCWDISFIYSYNRPDVEKKNGYFIINKLKNWIWLIRIYLKFRFWFLVIIKKIQLKIF